MAKRKRHQSTSVSHRPARPPVRASALLTAYAVTVAALFAASFFPQERIWGLTLWAYLPVYVRAALVVVAGLLGLLAWRLGRANASDEPAAHNRVYLLAAAVLAVVSLAAYVILRSRYHFLGDGYTVLSLLTDNPDYGKWRSYGASLVVSLIRQVIPGESEKATLTSFQSVAIGSGLIYLVAVWMFSRWIFATIRERFWFFALLLTSGFVLLFFGYVEYYSLFIVAVTVFGLTGLLIAGQHLSRWWILPALAAAMALHVLGAVLAPAAVYLLLADSKTGQWFTSQSKPVKAAFITVATAGTGGIFIYLYETSYFFRFAFHPLWTDRFTRFSGTAFSPSHLADVANLFLLLLPGLLVLLIAAHRLAWRRLFRLRDYRFLLLCCAGAIAAALFIEAKLGLARDWDLFAFTGPPVAIFLGYVLLQRLPAANAVTAIALAVSIGLLTLGPRVAVQNDGDAASAQFLDHILRDRRQARTAYIYLTNYYQKLDEHTKAADLHARWQRRYPELGVIKRAKELRLQGQYHHAINLAYQAAALDPRYGDAWSNLSEFYIQVRNIDSALIAARIGQGLNPGNWANMNNLATAYLYSGDTNEAKSYFLRAALGENNSYAPYFNLMRIAQRQGETDAYADYLQKCARRANAPANVHIELADYYLSRGELTPAGRALNQALQRGADTALVRQRREQYPGLELLP
jgi:Flp pilus assembly protein TadD